MSGRAVSIPLDAQLTNMALSKDVVPEKAIAFINYADITSAIAAVEAKRSDPAWAQYRINYGKDRCANPPKPIPIPGRNKAAIDGFAEAPAAAEAVDPFVAPERTPPAVNGRPRSPPLPGPRPVTLSSFLAPPLPRAGYQQHQRSHSHQIKGTGLLERDLGAIGTGRPSSAQAMADMDDGRIPFRAKHKYRRSTSGVAQE